MNIAESISISATGLQSHKLRSFLTMLGIIFGVAAVIAMLSIGEKATNEFDRGNLMEIYVRSERGYTLLTSVGENALFLVLAKADAQIGLIFVDMRRMADSLLEIL